MLKQLPPGTVRTKATGKPAALMATVRWMPFREPYGEAHGCLAAIWRKVPPWASGAGISMRRGAPASPQAIPPGRCPHARCAA